VAIQERAEDDADGGGGDEEHPTPTPRSAQTQAPQQPQQPSPPPQAAADTEGTKWQAIKITKKESPTSGANMSTTAPPMGLRRGSPGPRAAPTRGASVSAITRPAAPAGAPPPESTDQAAGVVGMNARPTDNHHHHHSLTHSLTNTIT
jgi:hypothetical protein